MKAVKEQLEESGRNAEAVQREWYHAEQHLINVANARDQQSAHLENLRDGIPKKILRNPSKSEKSWKILEKSFEIQPNLKNP